MLTRIIIKDTVYLMVNEVCDILNISRKVFKELAKDKITIGPGKIALISENDYNNLLFSSKELMKRNGGHEEITYFQSLRVLVDNERHLLPLKKIFLPSLDVDKELEDGIENARKQLKASSKKHEYYKKDLNILNNKEYIDFDIFNKCGLVIQCFTVFNTQTGSVGLSAFLVGEGVFYSLFLDEGMDENWLSLKENENGDLIIDKMTEQYIFIPTVLKRNKVNRDFRNFSIFENLAWCVSNLPVKNEWQNELNFDKDCIHLNLNISILTKLFNPNAFPHIQVFEGIVNIEKKE